MELAAKTTKRPGNRKPAQMELVGGKGTRQRVWEAIRKHAGAFTCFQIARKSGVHDEAVATYVFSLANGGYLSGEDMTGRSVKDRKKWTLIRDNGVEAPRVSRDGKPVVIGRGMEAMWRSMRIICEFSAFDLSIHASAGEVAVSEASAKSYIGHLNKAGYLVVVQAAVRAGPNLRSARYRLAPGKYTGPRPPVIQTTKSVYDPNLGKVVWQEEPKNDDDL